MTLFSSCIYVCKGLLMVSVLCPLWVAGDWVIFFNHLLFFCRLAVWRFFGLGDASGSDSRAQRFKIRGHGHLQRFHHVRTRGGCELRPAGPSECLFHHHFHIHHFLYHGNVVPGICAKSKYPPTQYTHPIILGVHFEKYMYLNCIALAGWRWFINMIKVEESNSCLILTCST